MRRRLLVLRIVAQAVALAVAVAVAASAVVLALGELPDGESPGPAVVLGGRDAGSGEKLAIGIIVIMVFYFGVYPQPLLDLTESISQAIVNGQMNVNIK